MDVLKFIDTQASQKLNKLYSKIYSCKKLCLFLKSCHILCMCTSYLRYMLVDGINHRQGARGDLREKVPVYLLLHVAILLRRECEVVEEHVKPLLSVVHAEIVERSTIPRASQLPMLEPRHVDDVNAGLSLGAVSGWSLECTIDKHHKSVEGLVVETHHKCVEECRPTSTNVGEKEGATDGRVVAHVLRGWRRVDKVRESC